MKFAVYLMIVYSFLVFTLISIQNLILYERDTVRHL
jgi:hypothetical protein